MADDHEPTISDKYAAVFSRDIFSRDVLADILITLHWGVTLDPENVAMIAEYNAGLMIAGKAGLLNQIDIMLGLHRIDAPEEV